VTKPATAFSFSRLTQFEECPKKMHAVQIAKSVKENESEPMRYGKEVHKALEMRIKNGKKLPEHLKPLESMMAKLAAAPGMKMTEYQLAIDSAYAPCSWFEKTAYCRAIVDLGIVAGNKAVLFDYKTGKISDDFTQMRLTGAVFFQHHPEVEEVKLVYLWIKAQKPTIEVMHRDEIPAVWTALLPRINRYQHAFQKEEFPARQGWHCKYCPVKTCPYWAAGR
jgi:CRISPR/Cas system-associated exonuclease Cas4 (RecB family)